MDDPNTPVDDALLKKLKANYHAYIKTGLPFPDKAVKSIKKYIDDQQKLHENGTFKNETTLTDDQKMVLQMKMATYMFLTMLRLAVVSR